MTVTPRGSWVEGVRKDEVRVVDAGASEVLASGIERGGIDVGAEEGLVGTEACAFDELGAGADERIPDDVVGMRGNEASERGGDRRVRRGGDGGGAIGEALVCEAAWHELDRDAAGLVVDDDFPRALGRVVDELVGRDAHELGAAPGERAPVAAVRPCEAKADRSGGVGPRERAQDRERARVGDRADDGLRELLADGHGVERKAEVESGAYRRWLSREALRVERRRGPGPRRAAAMPRRARCIRFSRARRARGSARRAGPSMARLTSIAPGRSRAAERSIIERRACRRLRDAFGAVACESVARCFGADLSEGLGDRAAIVVGGGPVPCVEQRALDELRVGLRPGP